MSNPAACLICQERDHKSADCPELVKDLQPGFYKPSGGMPRGGDDEDESIKSSRITPLFGIFIKNNTGGYSNIQGTKNSILTNAYYGRIKSL